MKQLTDKISKNLKILDDTLYSCQITIQMGAKPSIGIRLEDILDRNTIKVWNEVFPKRKSPEIEVFGDLRISYNKVVSQKEKLYDKYAISFGVYKNIIPGSNLDKFLSEYQEKVVGTAQRELNRIKGLYPKRLQEYLKDVRKILKENSICSEQKLIQYQQRFPSITMIEKSFGPIIEGPYQMPSIHDAALLDLRLKSVVREAQLEKAKIAQLNTKQQEYWGISGQVQQVCNGLIEKISEIKFDILENLKFHLETIEKKNSFYSSSKKTLLKDVGEIKRTLASVQVVESIMGEGYLSISSKIEKMLESNDPSCASEIILLIESELYIVENLESTYAVA
jgi:hypothetical protein